MNGNESIVSPRAWKSWVAPSAIIVSGAARPAWTETAARLPKEYPSVRPPVATDASIFLVSIGWWVSESRVWKCKVPRLFGRGDNRSKNPAKSPVSHGNGACGATENGGDCATDSQAHGQWPLPGTRSPHALPCAAAASAAAISPTRHRAGAALGLRRARWVGWCSRQFAAHPTIYIEYTTA